MAITVTITHQPEHEGATGYVITNRTVDTFEEAAHEISKALANKPALPFAIRVNWQ